ncbi:9267_t:CDS:1, partial [Racocetra fulgida]
SLDQTVEDEKDSGIKIYFMHDDGDRFEEIDRSRLQSEGDGSDSDILEIILESVSKSKGNVLNENHGSHSHQAHLNQLYEDAKADDESETKEDNKQPTK